MVLWEITLGTAYFLGLKRTYKLALKIQRRLVSPKRPKIRQFLHRKTRSIFDAALKVHREIQQRDIEVGRNLGNWILRWLDKMKPAAQIRVGKQTLSNNNTDKTMKKQLTDPVDPKSPRGYGNQESSRRLFTTSTNTWPVKPVGNSTQYRLFMSGPNNTFELKNTIFGFDGVVRKDIMQWMGRNQNLYYAGMKFTTATFATAMCNILPAITFVMAWIFRLEKVKIKSLHSQGKIIGTLVTIGGAMIMTLIRGPSIQFPWTNHHALHQQSSTSTMTTQDQIKGSIMITLGCFSWASFVILQAVTLKAYPVELSLTALVCMMGALEGSILTLVAEKANDSIWSIHWDIKLFAVLYSGIVCSGCGYYISGLVMQERGPVFVTAFNPLGMVIIAILGSSILAEKSNLGSVLGAVVIVVGLYLVIWGKSKDQKQEDHESSLNQQHNGIDTLILKHNVVNSSEKASSDLEVV